MKRTILPPGFTLCLETLTLRKSKTYFLRKSYLGEEKNINFILSVFWLHDFNGFCILILKRQYLTSILNPKANHFIGLKTQIIQNVLSN